MTFGLARACETKSKLHRGYITCKTPEAKAKYIKYRNKLKTILNKAENDFYAKKFLVCQGNQKRTWQILNSLLNKNQSKAPSLLNSSIRTKF